MNVNPAGYLPSLQGTASRESGAGGGELGFADLLASLETADWQLVNEAAAVRPGIGSGMQGFAEGTLLALTATTQLLSQSGQETTITPPRVRQIAESIEPWLAGMSADLEDSSEPARQGAGRTLLGAIVAGPQGRIVHLQPAKPAQASLSPAVRAPSPAAFEARAAGQTGAGRAAAQPPLPEPGTAAGSAAREAGPAPGVIMSPFSALLVKEHDRLRLVIRVPQLDQEEGLQLEREVLALFAGQGLPAPDITIHAPRRNEARGAS